MSEFKRKKILIVEDADTVQMMMKRWVSNAGFDVETASDGREALESVSKSIPDLVLLDVMMPELNGFAVCRELRSMKEMKDTPIIIVTGLASPEDSAEGKLSGANEVIVKPLTEKDLIPRIKHYLGTVFKK